jgi:hypothetical protein
MTAGISWDLSWPTNSSTRRMGRHHAEAYCVQVRYCCEDIDTFRERIRQLDRDIETKLDEHEVGMLLTTIDGIGPHTAARLIAVLCNPADFRDERALAAYVAVVPGLRQSGKQSPSRAPLTSMGNAKLRAKLYMPTLSAVRRNPLLRAFYERLICSRKAAESGAHGHNAKAPFSDLQRSQAPQALRAQTAFGGAPAMKRLDNRHGISEGCGIGYAAPRRHRLRPESLF